MIVMGVDTSCDETAVAVVVDGHDILSNVMASQHQHHDPYGGIVPAVAARRHTQVVNYMIELAINTANVSFDSIDLIAVASDQGLRSALAVGVAAAKSLSIAIEKPLVGIHHVEGHVYSNLMVHSPHLAYPFLCLTVAGGHTLILIAHDFDTYELAGRCRDDSAGEAYDKIGRRLGLGYPGGPAIERCARSGNPAAFVFPRPMIHQPNLDFSFSGLKASVNRTIAGLEQRQQEVPVNDIAASFQQAVIDILISKLHAAVQATGIRQIAIAGGVAANNQLRSELLTFAAPRGYDIFVPPHDLCVDNGAMIAGVGFHAYLSGRRSDLSLDCRANAPLGSLGLKYKVDSKYAV